jgi:GT2 family glycosyltransferase
VSETVRVRLEALAARDREIGHEAENRFGANAESASSSNGQFPEIRPFGDFYGDFKLRFRDRVAVALRWRFGRWPFLGSLLKRRARLRVRFRRVGDFTVICQRGCMLPADLSSLLEAAGGADFVYGDSLHFDPVKPGCFSHELRPGWSPERLLSHCYVGEVIAVRNACLGDAGGKRALAALSPHDRALRLSDKALGPTHIGQLMYAKLGTPSSPPADPAAAASALSRAGTEAECTPENGGSSVRVRRRITGTPRVAVIIPTRGTEAVINGANRTLVVEAVRQMRERLTYGNLEFVVVVDADTPAHVTARLLDIGGVSLKIVEHEGEFNFARKINIGVVHADAEYLLFANDDIEVESEDIVETLLSHLVDEDVSMVGPMLLFGDGSVQSAGHLLNPAPFDMYRGFPPDLAGGSGILSVAREVSSVIAAFALTRRRDFESVGGLCEKFPGDYNDVDYCLKLSLLGKRTVVTPHAKCIHFESKTRVARPDPVATDRLLVRWSRRLAADPFGNRKLQPWEFVWKTNVDTPESLHDAFGVAAEWDGSEWFGLNEREDRHLHRTRYYPKWVNLKGCRVDC